MKNRYEMTDQATFYFVTYQEYGSAEPSIKAWTDDKVLLNFYLKFHNAKQFKVRTVTDTYKSIVTILNSSCRFDEIDLISLITCDRDSSGDRKPVDKKHDGIATVTLPLTSHERSQVSDNANDFCSSMIDYGQLHDQLRLLKGKYLRALEQIGLVDVINSTVMSKQSDFTRAITMDEVMILLKFFPGDFS